MKKSLTTLTILMMMVTLAACGAKQPPGGDLWKIPVHMEQQR